MKSPSYRPLPGGLTVLLCLNILRSSPVWAQTGDGGAASGVQPGDIGAGSQGSENAGAQGSDSGSVNLSQGATIAIAVVVSVVVVLGITTAVLFFLAKKRQWKIKEGLRRSARRVTNAVKAVTTPLTPKKMTFSPIEKRKHADMSAALLNRANGGSKINLGKEQKAASSNHGRDLEKGVPASSTTVVGSDKLAKSLNSDTKGKTRPPRVSIPSSAFEMDSPQTPMWKKVFGR